MLDRATKIVFKLMNPRVCGLHESVHLIVLFYSNGFPSSKEINIEDTFRRLYCERNFLKSCIFSDYPLTRSV